MEDLREIRTKEYIKKKLLLRWILLKITIFFQWINKRKWKLLIILILLILIFPHTSGMLIGKWITNFIGSILKNIVL